MAAFIIDGQLWNEGPDAHGAFLYCSTSRTAFGPIFKSGFEAEEFLSFLGLVDPRSLSDAELVERVQRFRRDRAEWQAIRCGAEVNRER